MQDRWGRAWSRSPVAGFMLSAAFFATFPGPGIAMKSTTLNTRSLKDKIVKSMGLKFGPGFALPFT